MLTKFNVFEIIKAHLKCFYDDSVRRQDGTTIIEKKEVAIYFLLPLVLVGLYIQFGDRLSLNTTVVGVSFYVLILAIFGTSVIKQVINRLYTLPSYLKPQDQALQGQVLANQKSIQKLITLGDQIVVHYLFMALIQILTGALCIVAIFTTVNALLYIILYLYGLLTMTFLMILKRSYAFHNRALKVYVREMS